MLVFVLVLGAFTPHIAHANEISVVINGRRVNFEGQSPALVDGRTLVPLRGVFEVLGFGVQWDFVDGGNIEVSLTRDGDEVIVTTGNAEFTTNGIGHVLDVPAQIMLGSTMVPIRAIVESVGYHVIWDGNTSTVFISSEPFTVVSASTGQPQSLGQQPQGSGTASSPYLISSVDELAWVRDLGNDGTEGRYFLLTQSIGDVLFRIANFNGTFNGGGHTINLDIYIDPTSNVQAGLIGFIGESGVVRNLNLTGTVRGHNAAGGLAGTNRGIVENVHSLVDVRGVRNVGGVVGVNMGQISYSSAGGNILGDNTAGGLVGSNSGQSSIIRRSFATSNVSFTNTTEGDRPGWGFGGLAGSNGGLISESYATGFVTGLANVGGLVGGGNSGTIEDSYASGNVRANGQQVGGLVGQNNGTIRRSYATGGVLNIVRGHRVGGIAGWTGGANGEIMSSVAANQGLMSHPAPRRIGTLSNGTFSNNFALADMNMGTQLLWDEEAIGVVAISHANPVTPTSAEVGQNGNEGESITIGAGGFWGNMGWGADIWQFRDGDVPLLRNVVNPQMQNVTMNQEPRTPSASILGLERAIFDLVNAERASHGVSPLVWDDSLALAARSHSQDLVDFNMVGHFGSDGRDAHARLTDIGWRSGGENVHRGAGTPEEIVRGWMNSTAGHRETMLNSNFMYGGIGIEFVAGEGSAVVVTQKFGTNPR